MSNSKTKTSKMNGSDFFPSYEKFSNLLRTWLVTFGIGVIAFLASQETIVNALKDDENSKNIVILYLIGIALQVFGTIAYKYSMGIIYHSELLDPASEKHEQYIKSKRYKISEWISESFGLEFLFDAVTISLYFWATYLLASVVVT